MREIIDEVPTFYPRFKFWRDHDGVLKTPEGRAVRDPISGKKNSLFEIISLRYSKHFIAPKNQDMIQGKSFFKEK